MRTGFHSYGVEHRDMATYLVRTDDNVTLAQADLATDNRAMAWAVRVATEKRALVHGGHWSGYKLVDDHWERRFAGGNASTRRT